MKRGRLVLVIILVAVAALVTALWVNEGPLWRLVMLKRLPLEFSTAEGHKVRGWGMIKRSDSESYGWSVMWYVESGYRAIIVFYVDGVPDRGVTWDVEGKVTEQVTTPEEGSGVWAANESAPWWWGVTDQTKPTAPWWGKE